MHPSSVSALSSTASAEIEPKILLVVDGYRYGSKAIRRTAQLAEIRSRLPSLEQTVIIPYLQDGSDGIPHSLTWDAAALSTRSG